MTTRTRGALRLKTRITEIVFAPGTIRTVEIYKARVAPRTPEAWKVSINDIYVFRGTEKGARQVYDRALKYIR